MRQLLIRPIVRVAALWAGVLCLALTTLGLADTTLIGRQTSEQGEAQQPRTSEPAPIRFGMSVPLSGPSSELGLKIRGGVLAAFEEANRAGGIHGRRLELIAVDDGYEPCRSHLNVRDLVEKQRVLALVACVGTPTAVVNLPIALKHSIPYVGAYTGAEVVRPEPGTPLHRLVFNFRASYRQEIDAMVDALIEHAGLKPTEIGFFTQRDAYGDCGFEVGLEALRRHGLPASGPDSRPVHARYERNTTIVEPAVADMLSAAVRPRAVIMVGTYAPTAQFVRLCREAEYTPIFLSVSFVGSQALAEHLGPHGEGVIITQVVPPADSGAPVHARFEAARALLPTEVRPRSSMAALEGYCVGRMLVEALMPLTSDPTPEQLGRALEQLGEFDLGLGQPLRLDETRHQASDHVWPSVIRSGQIVSMDWSALRRTTAGAER